MGHPGDGGWALSDVVGVALAALPDLAPAATATLAQRRGRPDRGPPSAGRAPDVHAGGRGAERSGADAADTARVKGWGPGNRTDGTDGTYGAHRSHPSHR